MSVVRINQMIDNLNMIIYIYIYNDIVFNSLVVFYLIDVSIYLSLYIYIYIIQFSIMCVN